MSSGNDNNKAIIGIDNKKAILGCKFGAIRLIMPAIWARNINAVIVMKSASRNIGSIIFSNVFRG
jgi:hypothetical protein